MDNSKSAADNIIGIMGGTFNPIHLGHLMLAVEAHKQFQIPKILVMPSGNPSSYKSTSELVSAADRCAMISETIKDYPFLELSLIEVNRTGRTYTADTLAYLKADNNAYIYFIIGADSLFSLEKWYKPEYVLKNCHILAADRNNCGSEKLKEQADLLKYKYSAKIDFLKTPAVPYSSSQIRELAAANIDISNMVAEGVDKYIKKNNLYKMKGHNG